MHVIPRPPRRLADTDRRLVVLLAALAALLVLVTSAYLLNQFRAQRAEAQRNRILLAAWESELLTATPAALERGRLEQQRAAVQQRFAEASGRLPGTDVEVAILARIYEAATRSGVTITTLAEAGAPLQEGSLVGWRYTVAAAGPLANLTNFAARLEQEAFPSAVLADPVLNEQVEGGFVLAGDLTVYGSTLSTGTLVGLTPIPADQLGPTLREEARAALARGDFELALSFLLRLKALEPTAADVDDALYEAFVDYGDALLAEGRLPLASEQYEAALALDPNREEAVERLLALAPLLTPTTAPVVVAPTQPGAGPVVVTATSPPEEATPLATRTLPPTQPPPPTRPPLPTRTAAPPPTARPTLPVLPTVSPTSAGTATPVTPSSTPSPIVTPDPNPFGALSPFYLPNCGLTQVKGTIRDSQTNRPLNGITVRVWWDGAPFGTVYSRPTGEDPTRGPGEWDVVLANFPKAGIWNVAVVNRDDGALLSRVQQVETDTGPCQPAGSGHQVVIQDFIRYGEGPGQPGATLTASPIPSASRTPSRTPSVSPTASVTPTPSPTPVIYDDPVDPNEPIPDYPGGPLVRTVDVDVAVTPRTVQIFLNILHDDVGDLQITIVHPDGTRVIIHEVGDDSGDDEIRRFFTVSSLANRSSVGLWRLEVLDAIEGRVGDLISWQIKLQP